MYQKTQIPNKYDRRQKISYYFFRSVYKRIKWKFRRYNARDRYTNFRVPAYILRRGNQVSATSSPSAFFPFDRARARHSGRRHDGGRAVLPTTFSRPEKPRPVALLIAGCRRRHTCAQRPPAVVRCVDTQQVRGTTFTCSLFPYSVFVFGADVADR